MEPKRQIYILNAENEQEIHAAFTALTQRRIGALAVTGDTFFAARRGRCVLPCFRLAGQ
jgi:hypothetical protein